MASGRLRVSPEPIEPDRGPIGGRACGPRLGLRKLGTLLAKTLIHKGRPASDAAKAVETQQKAVSLLPPGDSAMRTDLEATLATYRAATTQPVAAHSASNPEP